MQWCSAVRPPCREMLAPASSSHPGTLIATGTDAEVAFLARGRNIEFICQMGCGDQRATLNGDLGKCCAWHPRKPQCGHSSSSSLGWRGCHRERACGTAGFTRPSPEQGISSSLVASLPLLTIGKVVTLACPRPTNPSHPG